MQDWTIVVDRRDFGRARVVYSEAVRLADGEARLAIEHLALSANTLTYAVLGEELGYWSLYTGTSAWGCIPAWGHARVTQSRSAAVPPGALIFGLFPMASHVTLCLRRSRLGWRETSPHRATLNPVYNQYEAEAITSSAALQLKAALHPIFIASFVLHDFLREQRWRGASALLVTSASSKIALGLAHLCSGSLPLVGLTAASRAPALGLRGIYATVAGYDELALLPGGERWLVVDFSGDDRLLGSLVDRLGSQCAGCLRAGFTHAVTAASGLVRPDASAAEFFFAPAQIVRRVREWGAEEFDRRLRGALQEFLDAMRDEFSVRHLDGAQALLSGYLELHRGTVAGSEILVARPQASGDALVDPA